MRGGNGTVRSMHAGNMNSACPLPIAEAQRLDALRRYRLLDTPREQCFDDFTMLANSICDTPIAAISLIDERRLWFKSLAGLEATTLARHQTFCAHAIMHPRLLVVEDATQDPRFAGLPQVTADHGLRFYAGAPLRDEEGHALGCLFVVDHEPRQLSAGQLAALQTLAGKVMTEIHYRMLTAALALSWEEIQAARGLLPICCHCKAIHSEEDHWESVESYIARQSETELSHGICDDCLQVHHPKVFQTMRDRRKAA